jgi:electron transport complex protein RnfD
MAGPPRIEIRSSPHIHDPVSVDVIMRHVVYALVPICVFAVYLFGLSAAALIVTVLGACLLTEHLFNRFAQKPNSLGDFSAAITGLLLALTLPPGFPLWMGATAGFIAIALGKVMFGGLGQNVFNPALVGRAFAQAAFPVAITSWSPALASWRFSALLPSTLTPPFMLPAAGTAGAGATVDAVSSATPLALQKFDHVTTKTVDLFTGMTSGSTGETAALLILLCGAYLALRRMLDWRIPAGMLGSAYLVSGGFYLIDAVKYPDPLFTLFSGGLMLGAVFMATDVVASPLTPRGVWIYGVLIGVLTVLIRLFGGLPEGVMYAILIGNAASPLIAVLTQPRAFGEIKRKKPT